MFAARPHMLGLPGAPQQAGKWSLFYFKSRPWPRQIIRIFRGVRFASGHRVGAGAIQALLDGVGDGQVGGL